MHHQLSAPFIMALGDVRRWHTRPILRDQTLADHGAQVALLAVSLDPSLTPGDLNDVLMWGLLHDAHECEYGDMPAPAKEAMTAAGIDVDTTCQDLFWGADHNPARIIDGRLLDLVHVADKIEAALFARKYCPGKADSIRAEAERNIRTRLAHRSIPFARAMAALEHA